MFIARLLVAVCASATALALGRPSIAQEVTWFYANDLDAGANFFQTVLRLDLVLDQGPCRIYRTAPESFLGVCDSRAAPAFVPPVTYTLVVPTEDEVDVWHDFLLSQNENKTQTPVVNVTLPEKSTTFNCYAFNFYDPNYESGLGYYRFEVQAFLDPSWPTVTL